jgi:hypothetical protein
MKIIGFLIILAGFVTTTQAQKSKFTPDYFGVGYGTVKDGWGDFSGQQLQFDVTKDLWKWSSITVRTVGTLIQENQEMGPGYYLEKKSNGVSLDLDYNLNIRFWRIDIFPSAGLSLRYAHNQHVNSASYFSGTPPPGTEKFEVDYEKETKLYPGFTLGLNAQVRVTDHLYMGMRLSGASYEGRGYHFWGVTMKSKGLKF